MLTREQIEEIQTESREKGIPTKVRCAANTFTFCYSSDMAIAIPRTSRAHSLARWHRFVSIERGEPL